MASSKATTVAAYLKELPPDRRAAITKVRGVIRKNLPAGYEEGMMGGVIGYVVPKKILPDTYNDQPLCYVALASQKNYMSLYLMSVYGSAEHAARFKADFAASGRKLDMGKSCVHFKKLDDLPLDLIGRTIAAVPMAKWIEIYKASRTKTARGKAKT